MCIVYAWSAFISPLGVSALLCLPLQLGGRVTITPCPAGTSVVDKSTAKATTAKELKVPWRATTRTLSTRIVTRIYRIKRPSSKNTMSMQRPSNSPAPPNL